MQCSLRSQSNCEIRLKISITSPGSGARMRQSGNPLLSVLLWGLSLKEEMITHFSILAGRIPWTKEPGELQSVGSQRDGPDWAINTTPGVWEGWFGDEAKDLFWSQALGLREARVGVRGTSWAVSALCLILTANLRCLSWVIIADCGPEWPLETCYQQVGSKDSRWFQRWGLSAEHTTSGNF